MQSVFFRRLVLCLAIAMLVAAVIMLGGYMFVSRDVYTDIKLDELGDTLDAVGELSYDLYTGQVENDAYARLIETLFRAEDTSFILFDTGGNVIYSCDTMFDMPDSELLKRCAEQEDTILEGKRITVDRLTINKIRVMALGKPVTDATGSTVAGVLLLRSSNEITGTVSRLFAVLLWMMLFAIPVGFLITAWRLKTIAEPLNNMSAAALEMAKGNFDRRLDDEQPGEVGVLAHALNNLCDELSHSMKQLSSEKGQLDQILQSLSDGVAAIDEKGELIHYNAALMRMFGAVDVSKKTDLISDETIWREFESVFESGAANTIKYPMPGERTVWITIAPVTDAKLERIGVVGLFKDMTEMEKLDKMRREYVANVSHELRTPLTAVRGLLEPLADGMVKDEEDRQRYYKIMLHEVLRLSRLITDMLALSRLQSGTDYMEPSKVDVFELVSELAEGYSGTMKQKGVELIVDCPNVVSDVMTDRDRIEQVLVILIDNALRYTPEGGSITLGLRDTKTSVELTVTDTGCGIPEADLPHIFERFYKVDKSRNEGGTGLGLSIASFIMEQLGESISVESKLGCGTRFTLTMKHYVKNAIALGPAGEKLTRYGDDAGAKADSKHVAEVIEEERNETAEQVLDAPFEVVSKGKKHG